MLNRDRLGVQARGPGTRSIFGLFRSSVCEDEDRLPSIQRAVRQVVKSLLTTDQRPIRSGDSSEDVESGFVGKRSDGEESAAIVAWLPWLATMGPES